MKITYHDIFGYLSGALMVVGMIPYLWSIIVTKETLLNRASWAIWSALGIINLSAYISAGEKETVWQVAVSTFNCMLLLVLSFKYGERVWYWTDTVCLCFAVLSVIIWRISGNPVLALAAGLSADVLGLIPTFLKVLRKPFSENLLSWTIGLVASLCNIVAVREWTWANAIYTLYMTSSFLIILIPAAKGQLFAKSGSKQTSS